MIEYNVPYGKKNRGLAVVQSFRYLKQDATEDEIHIASVIGWCIEWLQTYFLVADDIMDQSPMRRGKPAWFKNNNVSLTAINDAFYLEYCIFTLLKKYCKSEPYYVDLLELFIEIGNLTHAGQCLDMLASNSNEVDLSKYTEEKYSAIVKYKTAFYSFYLPVACAMYMVGVKDEESHADTKEILLQMGKYFQIQDDYLDCYGHPSVIGKVGTDIEENKCSWMIVQALKRATPEERKILEENYGQSDPEKKDKVKEIYKRMNLKQVFEEYEDKSYQELCETIEKRSHKLPKKMFYAYAQKIYKRKK